MKAVIMWSGEQTVIEGAELGDSRVADELYRLARLGVSGVSVYFDAGPDSRAEFDRRVLDSIRRHKYGSAPLNGEAL